MFTKQKGMVSIEFALGFLAFFSMIAFWVEVSYMGYVSAVVDYTSAEASRKSRSRSEDDYKAMFQEVLSESGSLWSSFIDVNKLDVETRYYDSVTNLVGQLEAGSADNSALAVYSLEYRYTPMYTFFFTQGETVNISREVITIQEHERSKFNE